MAYAPLDVHLHGEPIIHYGKRWFVTKDGYCKNRKGTLLHREIWKEHFGEIPAGLLVHHKDGNRLNFSINNLELCSVKRHAEYHPRHRWTGEEKQNLSQARKDWWKNKKPHKAVCITCGKEHESMSYRRLYCSERCRDRYHSKSRGNVVENPCVQHSSRKCA